MEKNQQNELPEINAKLCADKNRVFARQISKKLSAEELKQVSGGAWECGWTDNKKVKGWDCGL
ncbi:bacteriocin [Candidatus Berkiella cookevillensis]|uniref:Bacteriocin n=1 Tax=Candidatus Berkiella cookevillensis TaxID=437022 RepID=A0A0Q9YE70_9GAMM|nr:bacteriocin [Candidatus Berkiella cookevillensis]MCS5707289.1 bacteriocin [Candidatus Berkiella cookevillensis]